MNLSLVFLRVKCDNVIDFAYKMLQRIFCILT